MTFEQITNELKNKIYHPVYFLQGDEPYFIDAIATQIEDTVLSESDKEFNQTVLYGRDITVYDILDNVKRHPMMSNYQVVIVKEAQDVKKIDLLIPYFEKPAKTTLLVICYKYKKPDGGTKISKALKDKGVFFEAKPLYDNQVGDWIRKYVVARSYSIEDDACQMLCDNLGTELSKIVNELSKLLIILPPKTRITNRHIEDNIGISKDFNVFELTKALGSKNVFKANQIVNYYASNPSDHPIVVSISAINNYFSKILMYHFLPDKSRNSAAAALGISTFFINEYEGAARRYPPGKIAAIFSDLRKYDLRSKGVDNTSIEGPELLKELVFKILN
jgi:DNA polymerase-3 subunit delta